jgi:phosphopantetheine adenylyltransferase
MNKPTLAIYAGSFSPFTIGHLNIVQKTQKVSEEFLKNISLKSSYVANLNKNWGFIEDLKIGLS